MKYQETTDGYECESCGIYFPAREAGDEPVYECQSCGTIFNRDGSADGCSHRCPDCNKFASRAHDRVACPECSEGNTVEAEVGLTQEGIWEEVQDEDEPDEPSKEGKTKEAPLHERWMAVKMQANAMTYIQAEQFLRDRGIPVDTWERDRRGFAKDARDAVDAILQKNLIHIFPVALSMKDQEGKPATMLDLQVRWGARAEGPFVGFGKDPDTPTRITSWERIYVPGHFDRQGFVASEHYYNMLANGLSEIMTKAGRASNREAYDAAEAALRDLQKSTPESRAKYAKKHYGKHS
jgi:hypothetical protein